MKIVWTRFAIESIKDIYDYYYKIATPEIAAKVRKTIVSEAKKINNFPHSGQRQQLLSPLLQEHRYFLKGHYKIVYRVVNNEIVTDVFDTRQNPKGLNDPKRKLK
ncbi:type II toxin-antitoxin system RelE/ParE family toxin [Flavobacterium sp. DGU11]|uniref:Type II toxin-antitoxin system RelE/ParE family toxin n=1 Tax=Flavobacterium arundinis TaxID=3139143 RepID=A0ABU9I095_9FLAO